MAAHHLTTIYGSDFGLVCSLDAFSDNVVAMPPCDLEVLRRHALDAGYKAAREYAQARPQGGHLHDSDDE